MSDLGVSRNAAVRYLDELVKIGILSKRKVWKDNFYLNDDLFHLLSNVNSMSQVEYVVVLPVRAVS